MQDVLLILHPQVSPADRAAIDRAARATQTISNRVFVAAVAAGPEVLRAMPGVARVVTGGEAVETLPPLDEAESLFVRGWLSARGPAKQRHGEGLDWDTPPMLPPDQKR